jgi:hypothetical protein
VVGKSVHHVTVRAARPARWSMMLELRAFPPEITSAPLHSASVSTPSELVSGLLSELLTGCSSTPGLFGGISGGSVLEALICDYLHLPGFLGLFMATDAFASSANTAGWPSFDRPRRLAAVRAGCAAAARSGGP